MKYNTKQCQMVLSWLKKNCHKAYTVAEIKEILDTENFSIGITTIYRNLANLVNSGYVEKITTPDEANAKFQFLCDDHDHTQYHFKCNCCNKLIHINCHFLDEFKDHLNKKHNFQINSSRLMFYGTCEECKNNAEKTNSNS